MKTQNQNIERTSTSEQPMHGQKKTIEVERCGTLYSVTFRGTLELAALIGAINYFEMETYLGRPVSWNGIEVRELCTEQDVRDMNAERAGSRDEFSNQNSRRVEAAFNAAVKLGMV